MRDWAHHHRTDTVDDPVFRAAMRGTDSVSFVFSLEVTWSKIQQRQQEDEDRKAMEELQALQALQEHCEEAADVYSDNYGEERDGNRDEKESVKDASAQETMTNMVLVDSDDEDDDEAKNKPHETGVDVHSRSGVRSEEAVALTNGSNGDETVAAAVTEETSTSSSSNESISSAISNSSSPTSSTPPPNRSIAEISPYAEFVQASEEGSSPSTNTDTENWTCEKCTLLNPSSKKACQICKAYRSSPRRGIKRSRASR